MPFDYHDCDCECTGVILPVPCAATPPTLGPRPRVWKVGNTGGFGSRRTPRRIRGRGATPDVPPGLPPPPTSMPGPDGPISPTPDGPTGIDPNPNNPTNPGTPVNEKGRGWRMGGVLTQNSGGFTRRTATRAGETKDPTPPPRPTGPTTRVPKDADLKSGPYGPDNPVGQPTGNFGNEPKWYTTFPRNE